MQHARVLRCRQATGLTAEEYADLTGLIAQVRPSYAQMRLISQLCCLAGDSTAGAEREGTAVHLHAVGIR